MNFLKNGKVWPYAISLSIALVFIGAIVTIVVSVKAPVALSDIYMMGYQKADFEANDIIKARIAFDKKYKIEYLNKTLKMDGAIQYKVTDIDNNPVNNADIKLIITRPNDHNSDQEVVNPTIKDGIYTFTDVKLPLEGRWNIMSRIKINGLHRFYNIKTDTRKKEFTEY